jgi:hypothetical protein
MGVADGWCLKSSIGGVGSDLSLCPLRLGRDSTTCSSGSVGVSGGVYGVGYAIAAFNSMRHWPIVPIGLMGKILGPLEFAKALYDGSCRPKVGFKILTNDLIWWVPSGIILVAALRQMGARNYQHVEALPLNEALSSYRLAHGDSLAETSRKQTVLPCLLRHFG